MFSCPGRPKESAQKVTGSLTDSPTLVENFVLEQSYLNSRDFPSALTLNCDQRQHLQNSYQIYFFYILQKERQTLLLTGKWIVPIEYQVENLCDPVPYCNNCSI